MPPATSSTTTRPPRLRRSIVGRGGPIRPSLASWLDIDQCCRFSFGDGELVTLGEARQVPLGPAGRVEQASELLQRQPVALLPGFGGGSRSRNGSGTRVAG
jgi:hypothetical protein